MLTATCQHTGLTFEAKSKAAKNHPAVSDLLGEANKRGAYQAAKDAIQAARADLGADLTIEAVEQYVRLAVDGRREELQAERDLWRARRDAAREARSERLRNGGGDVAMDASLADYYEGQNRQGDGRTDDGIDL